MLCGVSLSNVSISLVNPPYGKKKSGVVKTLNLNKYKTSGPFGRGDSSSSGGGGGGSGRQKKEEEKEDRGKQKTIYICLLPFSKTVGVEASFCVQKRRQRCHPQGPRVLCKRTRCVLQKVPPRILSPGWERGEAKRQLAGLAELK